MSATREVEVGEVWKSKKSKERVRIGRVWSSEHFCGGGDFVRCHPLHGGKEWFAHVSGFIERFAVLEDEIGRPNNTTKG